MTRPFLTARWSNLCLFNYAVSLDILQPHVPPGLELDLHDGQAFVSLVAFDFTQTRVWGVPWPGYRSFPELNLRFYVRQGAERGVVFVRELVPLRLVAWMARRLYNENYVATPMHSRVAEDAERIVVSHQLHYQARAYQLRVEGSKPAIMPASDSVEHFFKEHMWGFGTDRQGRTTRYEVRHPYWAVYPVHRYDLNLDWGQVYGSQWQALNGREPMSVILAVGSAISVFPKGTLVIA